jgi:hypothetical protein
MKFTRTAGVAVGLALTVAAAFPGWPAPRPSPPR